MGYYVKVDSDVKLYLEDINPKGDKTVLFLHGWPGSHELFEYQFDKLPQMGYRCIGIDQRGFGKSDKPFSGYSYDRLSDDVKRVVEELELKNFVLAGHSTGGAIAIRYMAKHKEYGVDKLVLIAAAAPSLIQRPYFPYGLQREEVINIIKGTYVDRPKMLRDFGNKFFFKHITEAFSDWFFKLGLEASGWATASIAHTWLGEEELFNDLKKITVPTLICHGIHDEVCHFKLGEIQKQEIENSKLMVFEFSGHGVFYDQKDEFNKALVDFIEE
ncbi:alpha/beta hydrolase [Clostridium sp. 19966]|uniref:alpha/beta fold hydrolase n=1 Tax=Clostridium sp. 19966 TaxID=2768166 RepID=UPI0028DDCFC7|nr:alpha/beta hydrolase [Clostridium sp. 19966]MDT8719393.1 alpha/beta hydrolase [Clostridium sp. 19966]